MQMKDCTVFVQDSGATVAVTVGTRWQTQSIHCKCRKWNDCLWSHCVEINF